MIASSKRLLQIAAQIINEYEPGNQVERDELKEIRQRLRKMACENADQLCCEKITREMDGTGGSAAS